MEIILNMWSSMSFDSLYWGNVVMAYIVRINIPGH